MEYNSKKNPMDLSMIRQLNGYSEMSAVTPSVEGQSKEREPQKTMMNFDLYFLIGLGGLCIAVALIILSQVSSIG